MNPTSSNIYAAARERVLRDFAPYLSNAASGLFIGIIDKHCDDDVAGAISKSAQALSWHADSIAFVKIDAGEAPIDPQNLFEIIEGIDPICIVCAGPDAQQMLASAYRAPGTTTGRVRLFGREACIIGNMPELMKTSEGKQRAWALLKTLPNPTR